MPEYARKKRRPTGIGASGAGMGVDQHGGPVIDPTENVLEALAAESRHRDALRAADEKLRAADNKFHSSERRWHEKINKSLRKADSERLRDLAAQEARYNGMIDTIRSTNVENTSRLLAKSLEDLKSDTFTQIADLQKFRYESSGTTQGRGLGRGEIIAWIVAGVTVLGGVVGGVIVILTFLARSS